MQIHRGLNELPAFTDLVLTQGTFDGVHLGHQVVLDQVLQNAEEVKGESMLMTFYPHPRLVLQPNDNSLKLINTLEEKASILRQIGIDHLLVVPFTKEFSQLKPLEFVRNILVEKLNVKYMVVGHDHRFGRNREGDFNELQQMGDIFNFQVNQIEPHLLDEITISSTKIRNGLLSGSIKEVNNLLGRPFSFTGVVGHGQKLGRKIGFPTANVQILDPYKIRPAKGVYVIKCRVGNEWKNGVMNIGDNPTIEGKGFSIEAHLFEFEGDLYNTILTIELIEYLRPEKKFDGVEELTQAIQADCDKAKTLF